jgi:hypothetical protein
MGHHLTPPAYPLEEMEVCEVPGIIRQGKQIDGMVARQVAELMKGTDLLPLVGRHRDPVGKEKDLHESLRTDYSERRTIISEVTLAARKCRWPRMR